jgi:hypothetical protein
VPVAALFAVFVPLAAEDEPAVLGAFIVKENHARRFAVGMGMLLAFDDDPRGKRFVGDDQAQCAIRFNQIDALYIDLFKLLWAAAGRKAVNTVTAKTTVRRRSRSLESAGW